MKFQRDRRTSIFAFDSLCLRQYYRHSLRSIICYRRVCKLCNIYEQNRRQSSAGPRPERSCMDISLHKKVHLEFGTFLRFCVPSLSHSGLRLCWGFERWVCRFCSRKIFLIFLWGRFGEMIDSCRFQCSQFRDISHIELRDLVEFVYYYYWIRSEFWWFDVIRCAFCIVFYYQCVNGSFLCVWTIYFEVVL